ncbi:MAG: hypothetical protein AB1589_07905 [Cyanobacteriota bacterium]
MFGQSSIKKLSHPSLDVPPLQEFVVELDEQNEELLSGGSSEILGKIQHQVSKVDSRSHGSSYFDYVIGGLQ